VAIEMFNKQKLKEIKERKKIWEKVSEKALARFPERKKLFVTSSNVPVERVYTPLDVRNLDYTQDLGFPGEYPYARGVYPTMYRGRLWTMRQYAGFGTGLAQQNRLISGSNTCFSRVKPGLVLPLIIRRR